MEATQREAKACYEKEDKERSKDKNKNKASVEEVTRVLGEISTLLVNQGECLFLQCK